MRTLRVKPMNKGVFSLICGDGGLFQDGILGKSFRDLRLCPMGKLSSIGGYFFSSEKSLYLGSFVGVGVGAAVVSATSAGGFSTTSTGGFSATSAGGGGGGGGPPPSPGATTLGGAGACVHRKNRENEMHSATKRMNALQKRLGIIVTNATGHKRGLVLTKENSTKHDS
jgi:hypothetical protein